MIILIEGQVLADGREATTQNAQPIKSMKTERQQQIQFYVCDFLKQLDPWKP